MPSIKTLGIVALGAGCVLIAVRLLSADTRAVAPRSDATPDAPMAPHDNSRPLPAPVIVRKRRASDDDGAPESQAPTASAPSPDVAATSSLATLLDELRKAGVPPEEIDAANQDPAKHARLETVVVTFLNEHHAVGHQLDLAHTRAADEWFRAHRAEYTPIENEVVAQMVQQSMVAPRHIVTADGSFYIDANDNPSETYRTRRRGLQQTLDDGLVGVRAQLRLLAAE